MSPSKRPVPLSSAALIVALLLPAVGCEERQMLESALRERDTAWALRAAWLENPAELAEMKSTLGDALTAAAAAVPPFEFQRIGRILASFETEGRLELENDEPKRVIISGPGSPRRAVEVLTVVGQTSPGLVLKEAKFESDRFTMTTTILHAPTPLAPPVAEVLPRVEATWPWNKSLADAAVIFDDKISAADQTLGFSPGDLDLKKLALQRFVSAYESPARIPVLASWLEGRGEKMARGTFTFHDDAVEIDVTLAMEKVDMRAVADFLDGGLETEALKIDGNHVTATLRPIRAR